VPSDRIKVEVEKPKGARPDAAAGLRKQRVVEHIEELRTYLHLEALTGKRKHGRSGGLGFGRLLGHLDAPKSRQYSCRRWLHVQQCQQIFEVR
jgi:hypothetical protein